MAMHVEDHPMDYADFEGTIPKGNYGAGTVMVWDQGVYEDITGNATSAYYKGKLHIVMEGKKLKGEWILVKDRRDQDEGNRWLLIKAGKPLKLSAKADDTSVISGRSMAKIAKDNDAQWHSTTPEEIPMSGISDGPLLWLLPYHSSLRRLPDLLSEHI
ncbi:MAG: polymerase LigD, ligase domain protein [Verrucomicrobiaceae bacterium]|nr:polymerase LigD, ligase domain protein [Verrucomicrobiaceae bacterium]